MSRMSEKLAPDLFDLPPNVRKTDPATSHQAAARNKQFRNTDRIAALKALAAAPEGLTDFELGDKISRQQTSAGKRRGELRDYGYVAASEERRPAPSGSSAIVWKITESGRRALEELSR